MIIVDAYAIHDHATVMVVLDAAGITRRAMMHPRQLGDVALFAVTELAVIFHFVVYHIARFEIICEYQGVHRIGELRLSWGLRDVVFNELSLVLLHVEFGFKSFETVS